MITIFNEKFLLKVCFKNGVNQYYLPKNQLLTPVQNTFEGYVTFFLFL